MYKVILYYKFAPVEELERFCADHRRKCRSLNLLGRVYIAQEGINGTLAGTIEEVEAYKEFLCSLPGFAQTEFKEDPSDDIPFEKLIVRIRPEIVALKSSVPVDPIEEPQKHLSPKQWRETLESDQEYNLIDVRNNYETKIGYFEGAITPDVENFFDFEQWLDDAKLDKDKKVLMYCTGGIRCEKFSILMAKKGYKDVNQLDGGIIKYSQQEGGKHYKGKCFVFDDRLVVPVGEDQKPISKCEITGEPCDQYLNCAQVDCNKLFICSEAGAQKYQGCCSEECMNAQRKRPFDPNNIYAPSLKWHQYYDKEEWDNKLCKEFKESKGKVQKG